MLVLIALALAPARVTSIIGGETVNVNGEWPGMALLIFKDSLNSISLCGGVLITYQHILTVAHCLQG